MPLTTDNAERYCSIGFVQVPIGKGEVLVRCPWTNTTQVVPSAAVRVLARCSSVGTLVEHAERLVADGYVADICSDVHSIHSLLRQLVKHRLLVTYDECRQLLGGTDSGANAPIGWFAIPTRNRPGGLERALKTYICSNLRHGKSVRYCIIDFSDEASAAQHNVAMLLRCKQKHGVEIYYSGFPERQHFAAALSRYSRITEGLINFAIGDVARCLGPNRLSHLTFHGACYNTLLLQAAGELALVVDDDTTSRLWPAPDYQPGLALSSPEYPWRFRPFDHAEVLLSRESADTNLVSLHEQLLGRMVGSCVSGFAEAGLLSCPEPSEFVGGPDHPSRRILLTMAGLVGDCGTESSTWWLFRNSAEMSQLTRNESTYRTALQNRNVVRSVPRLTIAPIRECMSFNLGLDNRDCLPPFMPVQRNEDGLFAQVLRACYPDSYAGLLPYVLLHSPLESREFSSSALFSQGTAFRVCDILSLLLSSLRIPGGSDCSQLNLKCAGHFLSALAATRPERFAEVIRFHMWAKMGQGLQIIEQKIAANAGAPRFWLEDISTYAEIHRASMRRDDLIVPTDLRWVGNEHDSLALFQDLVSYFGRLLAIWPEIVEASRELASRGVAVARNL